MKLSAGPVQVRIILNVKSNSAIAGLGQVLFYAGSQGPLRCVHNCKH